MTLTEYFALAHGNQVALAAAVGSHQPTVRQWAMGERPIPVVHGAAIERATGGAVTRQELFPDTWSAIWPELAAPVPPHACTAGTLATQLGARKLANLVERGHEVIGHILHKDGQYALFDGSCRWLTKPQYQRLMHEQDGSLFGPAAAPADDGAKLRAAIASARHVFEGERLAEDVLHYLEQVLAATAQVPAQKGIEPGAENASISKETHTPLGAAPTPVAGSEWPAWARELDKVTADVKQIAAETINVLGQLANILSTVGADTFDQAAAAMAAESAQKVADAERNVARAAAQVALDPLVVISREVFSLSGKLQQPAEITVQLLMLAEQRRTNRLLQPTRADYQ
ncbi:transcriptional regulator [Duganella phyllosphaerae]|uniref:Uncharacterized protein n=1 Tax=Duganella phyllosphaerae TaxID=762836 RepID=A0A1E7W4M7_9BURK|nr:YdaS family helix-turn-helix protein [Duganella phyllosphaerae]OEZ90701.1 hypothetical protein DUPY_53080 [Duganella phyllosphaerae]